MEVDMNRFRLLRVLVLVGSLAGTSVGAESPTPVGIWLHPNERIQVEIAPCGDRLCGRIVWFRGPTTLKVARGVEGGPNLGHSATAKCRLRAPMVPKADRF